MKNLSNVAGSMTSIIQSNLAQINAAKSSKAMAEILTSLFAANNLDTPASRRLIMNVGKSRNLGDALQTVYNSLLCGSGLAVTK